MNYGINFYMSIRIRRRSTQIFGSCPVYPFRGSGRSNCQRKIVGTVGLHGVGVDTEFVDHQQASGGADRSAVQEIPACDARCQRSPLALYMSGDMF